MKLTLFLIIANVISCFFVPKNNGLTKSEIDGYPDYIEAVCAQSEMIQNSPLYKDDSYSIQVAKQTKAVYEKLKGVQLTSVNYISTEIAIGNWIGDVIRFLYCCISRVFLFQTDKENGLSLLLFSTKHGRKTDYWCKIGVALFCNVLFCILILVISFAIGSIRGGTIDFHQPIQVIPAYYQCPYPLTSGDLLGINGVIKIWAVAVQTIVLSAFCISLEFILSGLGIIMTSIISVVFYMGIPEYSVFQIAKYVNLAAFSQTENLIGNLIYLSMGDTPILYQDALCVVTIVIILVGLQIGKCNFKYHLPAKGIKFRKRVKIKRKTNSLFVLELRKLMRPHVACLVLGISIMIQVLFYSMICSGIGFEERLYENRMKQLEGVYTEETYDNLLLEKERVQNGQILYSDAQVNCLDKLLSISEYLEQVRETAEVHYVYSGGYEALVGIRKVTILYQPFGIIISLFLFLSRIFSQEQKYGMCFLNQSSVNRRKLIQEKVRLILLISIATCVFWWLPECIFIFQNFSVSNPFALAISVPVFSNAPSWMMLWQVIAIVWMMRIFASIITGLLIVFFSYKISLFRVC